VILQEAVVEGTLKPDGTLELDRKPDLSPGRVTVVLRQQAQAIPSPQENWFQHLQRIRMKREAESYPFMNEEEMSSHIDWLREGDRIDDLLREVKEQHGKSENA
jgi:hypothetical protein